MGRAIHTGGAVLLVVILLSLGAPASASPPPDFTCGPSWTSVPVPDAAKSINGLAAIGPDDAWAVGSTFGADSGATLALHWDGSGWTQVPTFDPHPHSVLNATAALDAGDVWAVGYTQFGAFYRTLAERWDGTSWDRFATPNVGTKSNSLMAVAAISPSNVWAVGYATSDDGRAPLIEHWNGSLWRVVADAPGARMATLLGVAAIAHDDVWAVGYRSAGSGYETLAEHWDGSSWTEVPTPDPGGGDSVLLGVSAATPGGIWAVGYTVEGAQYVPLSLRWDGSAWVANNGAETGNGYDVLRAAAVRSDAGVWAGGVDFEPSTGDFVPLLEVWDGSEWTITPGAKTQGSQGQIIAVTIVPGSDQVWAGGRSNGAFLETICPSSGPVSAATTPARRPARVPVSSRPAVTPATVAATGRSGGSVETATGTGARVAASVRAVDDAAAAGIAEVTKSRGAVVLDYDGDGWPDIFLGRHQAPARLYHNNQDGTFTEVDVGNFPKHDRHRCAAADVNVDGLLDIFCAAGANEGTEVKHDELWIQQPDHTFTDEAGSYGVVDPFGRGRRAIFADVNQDGYPDLIVGNDPDRADGLPSPDRLFINIGGAYFIDAPGFGLDREIGAGCLQAGDTNLDGYPDVLVCSLNGIRLFENDAGSGFTGRTAVLGLSGRPRDAVFADMDRNGRQDIVDVTGTGLRVWLWRQGKFRLADSRPVLQPVSLAVADVNHGGGPDVYVVRGQDPSCTDSVTHGDNCADRMLLNNGSGTGFTMLKMSKTQTSVGSADTAVAVHYPGLSGHAFLVLNGVSKRPGPVQLIAFVPA